MTIDTDPINPRHVPPPPPATRKTSLCRSFQLLTSPSSFLKDYDYATQALLKRYNCIDRDSHARLIGTLDIHGTEIKVTTEFDQLAMKNDEVHLFRRGRRAYTETAPAWNRYNRKAVFVRTNSFCIEFWRLLVHPDQKSAFYPTDRNGDPVRTNYGWKCTAAPPDKGR